MGQGFRRTAVDNRKALNPHSSVVVEACAGSGKTWLLVSRVVRLLLDGVPPGEILAITFTRKAAQEMQARLRDWLYDLAAKDDAFVRNFLRERAVEEYDIERMLPRARRLYQQFLLAKPPITISTFHGWFRQILQRAPLNSGSAGGVQLIEQTAELWTEAWQTYLDRLHATPQSETAQAMMALFEELGLFNTQTLLRKFADKRSEWWAYTAGQGESAFEFALGNLREELQVNMDADVIAGYCADIGIQCALQTFAQQLASNGTEAQCKQAVKLQILMELADGPARFLALRDFLCINDGQPRKTFKPTKKQDEPAFILARDVVQAAMQAALNKLQAQQIYRFNCRALRCGVALLDAYQQLKQRQQLLDFGDLEWCVSQLLGDSDHAEYMQYKLDSRYRHVLLDEFQDTNPLQWQILQSWFAASAAVESAPVVFVVGDPKQSIYRFRRADARLFDVVREFLQQQYAAVHLKKNETRRNAPAVLNVVNGVFDGLAEFKGYETHHAYQQKLPGYVGILPLAELLPSLAGGDEGEGAGGELRNPLLEPYPDADEGAREVEAAQFAEKLIDIVGNWQIHDEGHLRAAEFSDIMVLVRSRTHLKVYEHALRRLSIPFLTSRRGGLIDTLEASDIQALLGFLITPFADLALAHALRTPIFSCSDIDLMALAGRADEKVCDPQSALLAPRSSWWQRLKALVEAGEASPALQRAHRLLQSWLMLADKLPVHDLLDRIYFEGDAKPRYAAAVPEVMRATVQANLQAFLEIALNVDAGRYPSLPGFLREIAELRKASDNESPDEGRVSQSGNAVRIYTVHESKGLEAPIVWLLDTNARPPADRGYDALVDWPTGAMQPVHFSMYADKASRGAVRERYFEQDAELAKREDLNLLYVAMTRACQALLVSGNGPLLDGQWYQRIAEVTDPAAANPLAVENAPAQPSILAPRSPILDTRSPIPHPQSPVPDPLTMALPTGTCKPVLSDAQRSGIWLHGLLQHLAPSFDFPRSLAGEGVMDELRIKLHIPSDQMSALWQQVQAVLNSPELSRFFDEQHYLSAANELAYINAKGEFKRIDRLVEFASEVWVLDYKTGDNTAVAAYSAQLDEYRNAMQIVYPNKAVRCAVILADGKLTEM
jgi:ATP-dependent helicase/nuclease subunit A